MRRTKATLIYNCRFQSELVGPREIANFLVDLLLQTQSSCPPVTAARQPDFCVGFAAFRSGMAISERDQVQTVGSTTTKRSLIKPNSRHRSFSQLLISAVVNEHQQDTRALSLVCNGNRNSFLIDASVTPDSHQLSVHVAQATLVGTADRSLNRCCRAAVPRLVVDLLFANGINCIPR